MTPRKAEPRLREILASGRGSYYTDRWLIDHHFIIVRPLRRGGIYTKPVGQTLAEQPAELTAKGYAMLGLPYPKSHPICTTCWTLSCTEQSVCKGTT